MTWRVAPLMDLLELSVGGVWGKEPGADEVDVRIWRVTELKQGGRLDPSSAARRSIAKRQFVSRSLRPGDLLLEKSGGGPKTPVGRVGLVTVVPEPAVCANFMQLLRPDAALVEPRFLHLFLNHFHLGGGTASMQVASTNIRNIKATEYVTVGVPLPPMDEQRRIVDILEDHMSRLDAADAGLAAARRRSHALLESSLWSATHGAGDRVPLTDVADVRLGRQRSPSNHSGDRMVPYLRAANVDWNHLRLNDVKSMNFTAAEEHTYALREGDILLTEASGSASEVGKSAIYRGEVAVACFQNTLLRIRCHGANPDFIQKYLLAEAYAGRFVAESRGVGIYHLGRSRLANWTVELPDEHGQESAAAMADKALVSVRRLGAQIDQSITRGRALRRALLATAFSGKLTGEHTDQEVIEELVDE